MDDLTENDGKKSRRPEWFEPKLSMGNVLVLLAMVFTGVTTWSSVQGNAERIPAIESDIGMNTKVIAVHDQRLTQIERAMNREVVLQADQRREILERLGRIEDKLDRH